MLEGGYASAFPNSPIDGNWSQPQNWDILNLGWLMWQCANDEPDKIVSPGEFTEEEVRDISGVGKKIHLINTRMFFNYKVGRAVDADKGTRQLRM